MVLLHMYDNVNFILYFFASIPIEDFYHIYKALIFSQFDFQKPNAFSALSQTKVTTIPVSLYSMLILDV